MNLSVNWIAWQRNYRQSRPINGRAAYYRLRSRIRRLRRHSPTHYDVAWYADSLGIEPYSCAVSRRLSQWGRVASSGITGPVGKLP